MSQGATKPYQAPFPFHRQHEPLLIALWLPQCARPLRGARENVVFRSGSTATGVTGVTGLLAQMVQSLEGLAAGNGRKG